MREEDSLSGELQEFEQALARSMNPAVANVDAIAAAFEAGNNSAQRQVRRWRFAACLLFAGMIGIAIVPARRDVPSPRMSAVVIRDESLPHASPASLIMLQRAIAEHGLDGLPQSNVPPSGAVNANDAL